MKKFKFILPSVAFVFAIAVSFASVNIIESPTEDFIINGATCENLQEEVPCNDQGTTNCQVISESLGGPHDVYDAMSGTQCVTPKFDNTGNIYQVD